MTDLKNKKVLIIGGAGFVGSNLCLKLLENCRKKEAELNYK